MCRNERNDIFLMMEYAHFLRDAKHYSMTRFYREQRKRLGIMVEHDRPMGGKWSFDPVNRICLKSLEAT